MSLERQGQASRHARLRRATGCISPKQRTAIHSRPPYQRSVDHAYAFAVGTHPDADAFVIGLLVSALFLDIFFLMSTSDMLGPLSAASAHAGDRHVNLVAQFKSCFSVTDAMW